ncbi:MAG TPA: hypothetical protein VGA95_13575 [Thermodesulfobacteriota bacterium]
MKRMFNIIKPRLSTDEKNVTTEGGNKYLQVAVTVVVAVLCSMMLGTMAFAKAPPNDDFNKATVVTQLPFTDSINTSEARTARNDPDCSGQGPTVWYSYTPAADMLIEANTFGSDYDTTLSAYILDQGQLIQIACNDDCSSLQSAILIDASTGETVFFMVGSFASGPGGNLVFNVNLPPPPLQINLTLDPVGSVSPSTGVATISGTVTCSKPAAVSVFGNLTQLFARHVIISGFLFSFFECSGETTWSAPVFSDNGLFSAGKASASASADAFAIGGSCFDSAFDFVEPTNVMLKGLK